MISGILSGIYSGTDSDTLAGTYSDILSGLSSDTLSGNLFGIVPTALDLAVQARCPLRSNSRLKWSGKAPMMKLTISGLCAYFATKPQTEALPRHIWCARALPVGVVRRMWQLKP